MLQPMPNQKREIGRHRWLALWEGLAGEPFVRATPGVLVVPVTESGEVLFILEPSVVDGAPVLCLPCGAVDAGETPAASAARELREEVGYRPERLELLCHLRPLARHGDWTVSAFLAQGLVASPLTGDEPHNIRVECAPLNSFEQRIAAGRLLDATCIAALYLARARIDRNA